MKCIYTDKETDDILNEVQKDVKFKLSRFFKIAIKQYHERNTNKTQELETQAKKVEAEFEQKKRELELIQMDLAKEKTEKVKEEEDKRREKEASLENWINYSLDKIKRFFNIPEQQHKAVAVEYATLLNEQGVHKTKPLFEWLEEKGFRRKA